MSDIDPDDLRAMPLGERIRTVRLHGPSGRLSHDRLAAALGTSRQRVIDWEKHGSRPSPEYVDRLAAFTGLPPDVFRDEEPAPAANISERLVELEARERRLVERLDGLAAALGELRDAIVESEPKTAGGLFQDFIETVQQHGQGETPPLPPEVLRPIADEVAQLLVLLERAMDLREQSGA